MGSCSSREKVTSDSRRNQTNHSMPTKVSVSPFSFFPNPPTGPNVETGIIHHVYDGDTLTLANGNSPGARVRLLGIDAPEIKEKEPYAVESRDYLRKLCPTGAKVFLQFNDAKREDHYGRLLAYIFAPRLDGGGYICVNIDLLAQGLATVYLFGNSTDPMMEKLKNAQKASRGAKLNIWTRVNESLSVVVGNSGTAFHKVDNTCLRGQGRRLAAGEAFDNGFSPCRNCKPLGKL